MSMPTINQMWKHFITITKHKYYVACACFKCGLYYQGIVHDLSKYRFREFFSSAAYFQGNKSPINAEKAEKGYSIAWQWHKGCNPHHYEFWVDRLDEGGVPLLIPYKYAMEMICDWIGAGKAYEKAKWNSSTPLNYYNKNMKSTAKIHYRVKKFVENILESLSEKSEIVLKDQRNIKRIYKNFIEKGDFCK